MPDVARTLLSCLCVRIEQDLATESGAWRMGRNAAKEPFQIDRFWNELMILRGVLIVSSLLLLVLAFCPP